MFQLSGEIYMSIGQNFGHLLYPYYSIKNVPNISILTIILIHMRFKESSRYSRALNSESVDFRQVISFDYRTMTEIGTKCPDFGTV